MDIPPKVAPRAAKIMISIRLRPETLEIYKRMGKGWQTRISEDLDHFARQYRRPLSYGRPFRKGAR